MPSSALERTEECGILMLLLKAVNEEVLAAGPPRAGSELSTRGRAPVSKICTAAGLRLKIYWVVFSKGRNAVDVSISGRSGNTLNLGIEEGD
jgi:hypothetical protein